MKKLLALAGFILLLCFSTLAKSNIISTTTLVNKHSYEESNEKHFSAVKINQFDSGKISFNLCEYERLKGELKKDCSISIGSEEGYLESVAKERLFDYTKKRNRELLTSGTLAAAIITFVALRFKAVATQKIKQAYPLIKKINQKFFLEGGSLFTSHGKKYSLILTGALGGQLWLINSPGDNEKILKNALASSDMSPSKNVILVEDLDVNELADKLSRAL